MVGVFHLRLKQHFTYKPSPKFEKPKTKNSEAFLFQRNSKILRKIQNLKIENFEEKNSEEFQKFKNRNFEDFQDKISRNFEANFQGISRQNSKDYQVKPFKKKREIMTPKSYPKYQPTHPNPYQPDTAQTPQQKQISHQQNQKTTNKRYRIT